MSSQHRSRTRLLIAVGLAVAGGWFALASTGPGNAGQPPTAPVAQGAPAAAPKAAEERPADRAGVQKALDSFTTAFGKGDAKAVAAHFTPQGEYISDDGTT